MLFSSSSSPFHPHPHPREEELLLLHHLRSTTSSSLSHAKELHARLFRRGLHYSSFHLTALLRLYSFHPLLSSRLLVSSPTPLPTFAWNLLLRSRSVSLNLMLSSSVCPDKFTFPFAVASACCLRDVREIHGLAIKLNFYKDTFLHNTLMNKYLNFEELGDACKVFDKMPVRNVVSWTTLLSGLIELGDVEGARHVFDEMPSRNVVSWTAMINGYARNGLPEEAFQLFHRMREEGVPANEFTLVGLLMACTEFSSLELGRWVHDFACKNGGMERDVFVGTALVDMYSKCGSLEDAMRVFNEMPVKSLATWNAMITSLGVHGYGRQAVNLFMEMEKDASVTPDAITFVGVLCACVRGGMFEEGCHYFIEMTERYGIKPTSEHWSFLAELMDRSDQPRQTGLE